MRAVVALLTACLLAGCARAPKSGAPEQTPTQFSVEKVAPAGGPAARRLERVLAPYAAELEVFRTPIGESETELTSARPHRIVGCWMADVMREHTARTLGVPIDVAFINAGGIRAPLPAGPITRETMFRIMPFDNKIAVFDVTGAHMNQLAFRFANDGGYFPTSGFEIEADADGGLLSALVNGEPIDPERPYRIVTSDYVAGSMDLLKVFPDPLQTSILLRDQLIQAAIEATERGEPIRAPEVANRFRQPPREEQP